MFQLRRGMEQIAEGVKIHVKVIPKAKNNVIENWPSIQNLADEIRIRVTAPPEKGQANKAVIELLSKNLNIGKSSVILLSGDTSRNKTFLLKGLDIKDIHNVNS